MDALLHQIFSGLANGCIYGSVGLALVMIYQATHHINFAQGEMATFSTFIAWALLQAGWPYWGAFFATIAISFAGGLAVQRIILKPVEKAPVLTNVIVFIGLLVIFNSVAGWIFEHTIKAFPSPFPQKSALATRYFSAHEVGSAGVILCVLAALYAFFRYTPIGLAMRAAAQNPDSARLVESMLRSTQHSVYPVFASLRGASGWTLGIAQCSRAWAGQSSLAGRTVLA